MTPIISRLGGGERCNEYINYFAHTSEFHVLPVITKLENSFFLSFQQPVGVRVEIYRI